MEEAKLIFELVNRSGVQGGGGPTAPAGQQPRSSPSVVDQFTQSTAGGVGGALNGRNPQRPSQPAASVPPSPAAPVSQPIVTPVSQQPAAPAAPGTQAPQPSQQPGQPSAPQEDVSRQVRDALKTAQSVASQIPGFGSQVAGVLKQGAGIADTISKLQPLFAPKMSEQPGGISAARRAERESLGESLLMPSKKPAESPIAYPSQRGESARREQASQREVREFDEMLRREQESRLPLGLDDGPALPVPPQSAAPVSAKAAQHLPGVAGEASQAVQVAQMAAPAAGSGAAGAGGAAGAALSSAGSLAAAAAPIALPVAAAAAAAFAEYKALEFANNTARRIAGEAEGQIAGLSPEVAMAQAQERLNQLQANFRTSERLGDEVAGFIENRSALNTELQELRDKIGEPLLRSLNTQQDILARLLAFMNKNPVFNGGITAFDTWMGMHENIWKLLTFWLPKIAKEPQGGNIFMWYDAQPPLKLPPPFNGNDEFVLGGRIDQPGLEIN